MPFDLFSDEQLSARMSMTPEGFMICRDAVFARTGEQEYRGDEVMNLDADDDGWIGVDRDETEVFHPRSLASYVGKSVVMLHPEDMVGPHNVRGLQVGHVMNARRGEGELSDCVVGDLFITDRRAIEGIRSGAWRSLSAGYDARYAQHGRGRASQHDIAINHLALLPTGQARCGDRCVVRDAKPRKGTTMRTKTWDQSVLAENRAYLANPNWTQGGSDPGSSVGPSLIMELEGPASAYFILDLGQNRCGVMASSGINAKLDNGTANVGSGMPDARHTGDAEARRRAMVQADADWSRKTLRGINEANARFWASNGGKS